MLKRVFIHGLSNEQPDIQLLLELLQETGKHAGRFGGWYIEVTQHDLATENYETGIHIYRLPTLYLQQSFFTDSYAVPAFEKVPA